MHFLSVPCVLNAPPSYPSWFVQPNNIWWSVQIMLMQTSPISYHFALLGPDTHHSPLLKQPHSFSTLKWRQQDPPKLWYPNIITRCHNP
jgi:hypothetical protein